MRPLGIVQARTQSLTPTALRSFETCPRQFELTYLDKERGLDEPSADLILGNAMHAALAELFRLPIDHRDLALAQAAFRKAWAQQQGREEAFLSVESEIAVGRSGLDQLEAFFEGYAHEVAIKPLGIERWLRAPLTNGAIIGGRLDRVDRGHANAPAGSLVVTDYKTGACHFDTPSDLADDRGAQVYALLASRAAGQPVTEVCFHYLRDGFQLRWPVEQEDLERAERRLLEITREVHLEQEFLPQPGHHCGWCKHRLSCPEGEGPKSPEAVLAGAEEVTPF